MSRTPPFHPNCGKLVKCDECLSWDFAIIIQCAMQFTEGTDYMMPDWLFGLARRAYFKEGLDITREEIMGLVSGFGPDDPHDEHMNALVAKYPLLDIIACEPYAEPGQTELEFEMKWKELYGD